MSDDNPSTSELLRQLVRGMEDRSAGQISAEDLDAYVDGRLAADEAERVRDSLIVSRTNRRVVQDLVAFPEIAAESSEDSLTDEEFATDWLRFQANMAAQGGAPVRPATPSAKQGRVSPFWASLAAAFALASLGLTFWNRQLQNRIADLSEPRFVSSVSLPAIGQQVRGDTDSQPMPDYSQAEPFNWIFSVADPHQYPRYEVEILYNTGRKFLSIHGKRVGPGLPIMVTFSDPKPFPPGVCLVDVYGLENGQKIILGKYYLCRAER